MRYFDMHCDTLSRCADEGKSIYDNDLQISLKRLNDFDYAVQFFAAYINTYKYDGEAGYKRFLQQLEIFKTAADYVNNAPNVHPVLTVESLSALGGKIERIGELKGYGVKVASLNWNGYNGIAGGMDSDEGISDFGREVVRELERNDIIIDVSHLNDRSFFELCDLISKPIVATHSNSRSYCANPRNLTDEQLKIIFESGGVVGLNLYDAFLGERLSGYDDLLRHIDNMYKAGGEGHVALGSDFDGCDTDERFNNVSDMPRFYDYIAAHLSQADADGIFYDNAARFFDGIVCRAF